MWTGRMILGVAVVLLAPGAATGQEARVQSAPPPIRSSVVISTGNSQSNPLARPGQHAVIPERCAAVPPAEDSINYRVYAALEVPGRKIPLPSGYRELVLDALRHGLFVPHPLDLTVYAPMLSQRGAVMVPAVLGEIAFTLDPLGKPSDVRLSQSSLSAALDRSLFDAPRRADSLQALPGQIGVDNPGPVRFFLALSPYNSHQGTSMPFFAVRMPALQGGRPAVDTAGDVQPTITFDPRDPAVGDSVTVQFVVDERGVPVKSTMRVLSARYIEYAQLVMGAILRSQYIPAMAGGCPVSGLLERTWRIEPDRH